MVFTDVTSLCLGRDLLYGRRLSGVLIALVVLIVVNPHPGCWAVLRGLISLKLIVLVLLVDIPLLLNSVRYHRLLLGSLRAILAEHSCSVAFPVDGNHLLLALSYRPLRYDTPAIIFSGLRGSAYFVSTVLSCGAITLLHLACIALVVP